MLFVLEKKKKKKEFFKSSSNKLQLLHSCYNYVKSVFFIGKISIIYFIWIKVRLFIDVYA